MEMKRIRVKRYIRVFKKEAENEDDLRKMYKEHPVSVDGKTWVTIDEILEETPKNERPANIWVEKDTERMLKEHDKRPDFSEY